MTPERYKEVGQLYRAALEVEPERRAAFLAEACGGDEALRQEVESLLGYQAQSGGLIDQPALEVAAKALAEDQAGSPVGQSVGHYRILSLLGKGGMGEVYSAQDTRLGRKVALKLLPAQFTQDTDRVRRFEREARAASALNHPNIITIFDIGQVDDTHYIATEFVDGQTLRKVIGHSPMNFSQTLDVVTQVASALGAAHQAGIVHRDIKPENIMVRTDGYVKVLDFGLAKLAEQPVVNTEAPTAYTVKTETGAVMGTPHYMSPEQVRGEEVDRRTDLFSFGVVMYEMVTGEQPFQGATSAMVFDAILHQAPPSLLRFNPELPSAFARIITRALEKDRERRYQTASELRDDLGRLNRVSDSDRIKTLRRMVTAGRLAILEKSNWRRVAMAGIALIVLAAGATFYYLRNSLMPREAVTDSSAGLLAAPGKARRSVSVFGFKNLSGRADTAWLSPALSEMLTTELAAGERLRAIPGESVARMKIELALAEADSFSRETLGRIRQNLGTDLLLLGSYLAQGEKAGSRIRLDLRLQDAAAGETIASVSESGTETELPELVSRAGARLREKIGVSALSPVEEAGARASLPSNAVAARFYSEGLAKLRLFDALGARDLLEKAIAAEPDYPLAHAALAEAWSKLGYDEKAKEAAKRAFDLSARLLQEERLSVEGRYREMTQEWELATELYRRLQGFFPDNLDYGLRLAEAQMAAGQGKEALATVEALRRLPAPASMDVRVDLAEARAAGTLADHRRQQAAANKAAEKAKKSGARLLFAEARLFEGSAVKSLGEAEKAKAAFEEARQIYSAAGDQRGVSQSLYSLAAVLREQGDIAGAKKFYTEALAIDRQIGNKRGIASKLNLIGNALYEQGDYSEATKRYEESLQISREIGDKAGVATALNNIANSTYLDRTRAKKLFEESAAIYREIGNQSGLARQLNNIAVALEDLKDLSGAKKNYEEALAIYNQIGEKVGIALAKMNVGGILYYQGKLGEAKKLFEEAVVISREIEKKSWVAAALSRVAEVLMAEGNLSESRAKHEEALAIRNELGEKETIAESQLALAQLSIEEGQPEKAVLPARQAAEVFRAIKAIQLEPAAGEVLAQSLLAQGKIGEAQNVINQAQLLASKTDDLDARFPVSITAARVSAAAAKFAEARKILTSTLAGAARYGYAGYELEARLALGEVEMKSGRAAGRARLEELEKEAKARGYGLIARKAAAAKMNQR